ncbi:trypsin-like serine peptidase [Acetobacter sp.]|uniref:trypsin-like serine peptidase n=1 Tax=Acetobacter sp. TaxID=440 RepID=UPI0025BBFD79|nr:trypsin-like peptidase domain-containing protein [Acetobacter sp.]MCH4090527.1 trypsin-like serine protease [Acetobacter sp.]MCI1299221.1 trypsin-like serine protease [Acetobacter sp.]MCI1315768.1 trypsin-like serine protease [Acetobacter sp.]
MIAASSLVFPALCRDIHAAIPQRPGIGQTDHRQTVDTTSLPWSAIGRVQTELGSRCTGFLVAPTVVETAAHCLFLPKTGRYIQPRDVHFLRAYSKGQYAAHARVLRLLVPAEYDPRNESRTAAFDRATLFLEAPVSTTKDVLAVSDHLPASGADVVLGGYEQDFSEIVRSDMECRTGVLMVDGGGRPLITHDCSATRGSSGAPLLSFQEGRWTVLGVQVLANYGRGGVAAPLSPLMAEDSGRR